MRRVRDARNKLSEVEDALKRLLRRIKTAPCLWLMIVAAVMCVIFCGISLEKSYSHKVSYELRGLSGEVYREPWNGEKDFVFAARDKSGKGFKILVKGDYLYRGTRDGVLAARYCRADVLKVQTPQTAGNFFEFDYCRYLKAHGIDYVAYPAADSLSAPEKTGEGFLFAELEFGDGKKVRAARSPAYYSSRIREDISRSLDKYFSGDFSALIKAVMTGETGALDTEARGNLTSAGFSHLIAVSGAHVSFFTLPFSALLGRTLIKHDKRKLLLIIPVVFLWFAAGGSCTVTRAAITFICSAVACVMRRPPNGKNMLGIAGLITIASNPYCVFGTGFLLSYGAALSVLEILPALKKLKIAKNRVCGRFLPGAAVNAGLLPVLMRQFGAFSPCGMLLSVPASYVACAITVGGYAVYLFDKVFCFLSLKSAANAMVSLSYGLQKAAGDISGGGSWFFRVECAAPGIAFFAVYYALLAWLVTGRKGKLLPAGAVLCAVIAFMCRGMTRIEVLFFDVGQGSAALVRTVDGVAGLVDTGTGDTDLVPLLKKEGVFKLDFIVISHGHSDHYGGLQKVLAEYSPGTVYVPDNAFDDYCNDIGDVLGVNAVAVDGSLSLTLGKYTVMRLVEPYDAKENLNDGSLVVCLEGRWGNIVLPGDAENGELGELAERGEIGKTGVFCLAHHGSVTSGDEKLLWEISPKYVIISAGYGNNYGHPSKLVLETLKKQGVGDSAIFRTDRDGAIRVTAGESPFGGEFTVIWRKRRNLF